MIRRTLPLALALALAATAALGAAPAAPPAAEAAGRVVESTIDAPSLRGNLLGDPDHQGVAVYLPPGYDSAGSRRYPVIYLLHGIGDTYTTWTHAWHIADHMDRLIAAGRIPATIVVMPNGRNALMGSFYLDSPVIGNWERYIAHDVVAWADATYRTIPDRRSRAIVGHSMGGFGAVVQAMRHPDVFSVAYAMSPCCLDMVSDMTDANEVPWKEALSFTSYDDVKAALAHGDFYAVAVIGLCSAVSPDPDRPPLHVDFPYRLVRGELLPAEPAYTLWNHAFPVRQVDRYEAGLKTLAGLRLDYGVDDQFPHIPIGALEFSEALGRDRIPHTLEVYAGDHRNRVGERLESVVLPWVADRLVTESASSR